MSGKNYYFGAKCPTCGFARRYKSNRKCVNCAVAPAAYIVVTPGLRAKSVPALPPPDYGERLEAGQPLPRGTIYSVHRYADEADTVAKRIGGKVLRCIPT